jgi:hypothetical protein
MRDMYTVQYTTTRGSQSRGRPIDIRNTPDGRVFLLSPGASPWSPTLPPSYLYECTVPDRWSYNRGRDHILTVVRSRDGLLFCNIVCSTLFRPVRYCARMWSYSWVPESNIGPRRVWYKIWCKVQQIAYTIAIDQLKLQPGRHCTHYAGVQYMMSSLCSRYFASYKGLSTCSKIQPRLSQRNWEKLSVFLHLMAVFTALRSNMDQSGCCSFICTFYARVKDCTTLETIHEIRVVQYLWVQRYYILNYMMYKTV